ncbi:hypothetical protein DQR71_09010 [Salmonella enterica subsp. enterica serovar Kingston]|nr:hypothetical protein [Salmonella enterica subsp. enterica serovar Kingston]
MATKSNYGNTALPVTPYPIENYGELKQAVQLWADRDDNEFVNQIPNFIDFAQKEINRNLRWPLGYKEVYLYIKNGVAPIPTDYLQGGLITFVDNHQEFRQTAYSEFIYKKNSNPHATANVEKEIIFARRGEDGAYWCFWPPINAPLPTEEQIGQMDYTGDEVVLGYYADPVRLVNDSDTNNLIELCPDILLYSSLKHAAVFTQDKDSEAIWKERESTALKGLETQLKQQRGYITPISIPHTNAKSFW